MCVSESTYTSRALEAHTGEDLVELCEEALIAQAKGRPVDEDAARDAAVLLAAAQLRRAGLSMETVEQLFVERDYEVRLSYSVADDAMTIAIDWLNDGGCWRCDAATATTPAGLCQPCHDDLAEGSPT